MFIMLVRVGNGRWKATREDVQNTPIEADTAEDALAELLRTGGWKCSDAQGRRKG